MGRKFLILELEFSPVLQQNCGSNMVPGTSLIMPLPIMGIKTFCNKLHIMLPLLSNSDTVEYAYNDSCNLTGYSYLFIVNKALKVGS